MFLAVIRPGKRHLIGRTWKDVAATVWDKVEGEYSFKKSHSVAYSQLVVINMNLIAEQNAV
jgi:DNA polymerase III alpha subunit